MAAFRDLFSLLRGWWSSAPAPDAPDAVANYYDAAAFTSARADAVSFSVSADAVAFRGSRSDAVTFGEEAP